MYSIECDFYSKNEKIAFLFFGHPCTGLRGNVSILRWKARGRLSILVIIELFRYLLRLRRCKWKSAFFKPGERGQFPAISVRVERLEIFLVGTVLRY